MEKYQDHKNSNLKITEIAKTIGDEWNNLDQNQKSIYQNKAEKLKKSHEIEQETFKSSLKDREKLALSLLQLNNRAELGIITRKDLNQEQKEFLKSMPETSAFTPRGVFLSQRLKGISAKVEDQSLKLSQAMKDWSNLSANEQQTFEKEAQNNLETYKTRLLNFLKQ